MRISLIFLVLICASCTQKSTPKNYLSKITLKLEKNIKIQIKKVDRNNTVFKFVAEVQSPEPLLEARATWYAVDSNNVKVFKSDVTMNPDSIAGSNFMTFDSGAIELLNPDENYKIVFMLNGQIKNESVVRTKVYNTLFQEDLEAAIQELQDRNK